MPGFRRARPEDTVRADWWDSGTLPDGTLWHETATFRPQLTEGLGLEMAMLLDPRLAELKEKAVARGVSEAVLEGMVQRLTVTCTLFVALESWTLRTDPTPAQAAAGEPGDVVDLTLEALAELDPRYLAFLIERLAERIGGDFRRPAPGGGADPGRAAPAAGLPVPGEGRARRRGRPAGAGHPADGDGLLPLPLPAE